MARSSSPPDPPIVAPVPHASTPVGYLEDGTPVRINPDWFRFLERKSAQTGDSFDAIYAQLISAASTIGVSGNIDAYNLDDLDDVDADGPAGYDAILYDTSSGDWLAQQISLPKLSDVSSTAPTNNQILVYSTASSEYIPTDIGDLITEDTIATASMTVLDGGNDLFYTVNWTTGADVTDGAYDIEFVCFVEGLFSARDADTQPVTNTSILITDVGGGGYGTANHHAVVNLLNTSGETVHSISVYAVATSADKLLQEGGDALLQEDGKNLLLDA